MLSGWNALAEATIHSNIMVFQSVRCQDCVVDIIKERKWTMGQYLSLHNVVGIAIDKIVCQGDTATKTLAFVRQMTIKMKGYHGCQDFEITAFADAEESLKLVPIETTETLLYQRNGIVELESKPNGAVIKLVDYDTDGVEQVEQDEWGNPCIITEWG